jgi:glycosyltransferase involved in cell wall biosynthesis
VISDRTVRRVLAFPKKSENPYVELYSSQLEALGVVVEDFKPSQAWHAGACDVLHWHWPDSVLRSRTLSEAIRRHSKYALTLMLLRVRGARVVWVLHNLQAHEPDHWLSAKLFGTWLPRLCTHAMALSSGGLVEAQRKYPALRSKVLAVVPHGHYRRLYQPAPSKAECRRILGIAPDRFTFLFLGQIRPYKNVPSLIEAFKGMKRNDAQLLVAGLPRQGETVEALVAAQDHHERIHLHLKHIPEPDIPVYLGACDLVVLPFKRILNSGSAMLALSLDRPLLAPRLGALVELQEAVGEGWVRLYDDQLGADVLEAAANQCIATSLNAEGPDLGSFDWEKIGRMSLAFYEREE